MNNDLEGTRHAIAKHALYMSGSVALLGVAFLMFSLTAQSLKMGEATHNMADLFANMNRTELAVHQQLVGEKGKPGTLARLDTAVKRFDTLVQELNATSNVVRQVAIMERGNVTEQSAAVTATLQALNGAVGALQADAGEAGQTIRAVREKTLPGLDAGVASLNTLVVDLQPTALASAETLRRANDTLGSLQALVADPALKNSLANIDLASQELVKTGVNVTATTGEVKVGVGYVVDMVKPTKKGFWENVGTQVLRKLIPPIF